MATRLDAAQSANATTLAYSVSAADNRRLVVFVGSEGTQAGQHTLDYGGQTGTHEGESIAGSGTTQQTVSCFTFTDAQIAAASGTTLTAGNVPADFNISARSYQDCEQGALTNVDTDNTGAATPNPLAALDIVTSDDDAIVAAFVGAGNATTATWASPLTEQTDQVTASAMGSMADDEVPTATTIACEPTIASQNRAAGIAIGIEHLSSIGISGIVPSEFDMDNADIDINGSGFGASIGASDVYLSPNDLLSEAGEVDITAAVNTWSDTVINLDLTQLSAGVLDDLHTMGPGARFVIVNVGGVPATTEYFIAVTLHRPQAIEMVLSIEFAPSITTSRITGMSGTFAGGRIEETAAQNPSTTNTDVAADGRREDVWNIQAKPNSRDVSYDFRVLYGPAVAGTITQTPQLTVSGVADIDIAATIALTNTLTADVDGSGSLVAPLSLVSDLAADLDAPGGLAATLAMASTFTPDLDGAGELSTTMALATLLAADVKGIGELAGALNLVSSVAADLDAPGSLAGTINLSSIFVPDLDAAGSLAGTINLSSIFVPDLDGAGELAGALNLISIIAPDLDATGTLAAAQQITLTLSADVGEGEQKDIAAILATTLSIAADLDATGSLASAPAIAAAVAANLNAPGELAAAPALTLSAVADLTAQGELEAANALLLQLSADIEAVGSLAATPALTLSTAADLTALGELEAAIPIALAVVADVTETDPSDIAAILSTALTAISDVTGAGELNVSIPIAVTVTPSLSAPGDLSAVVSATLTLSADVDVTILTVTCTLVARDGTPLPNMTALSWAWFDAADPGQMIAPTDQGEIEVTDGSGTFDIELPNTTLSAFGVGTLVLRSDDETLIGAYNLAVS